jgi:hypothetical protein
MASARQPRLTPNRRKTIMNKARRKAAAEIIAMLDKIEEAMEEAFEALSTIADEEREAFDNMPESVQNGERGQAVDEAATNLETARDNLESAKDSLSDVRSSIEEAAA